MVRPKSRGGTRAWQSQLPRRDQRSVRNERDNGLACRGAAVMRRLGWTRLLGVQADHGAGGARICGRGGSVQTMTMGAPQWRQRKTGEAPEWCSAWEPL